MANPFSAVYGNEKLISFFRAEAENGHLAHAYILEGETGSGRHTLATAVARALAGDTSEGEKIARGISLDVKEFGLPEEKKVFTVDIVRRLKADAAIKPNELPFKLYILSDADAMNIQAQNAALKLLEEPPEESYFFLLCKNAAALLPTVRSRAPVLRMQRFTAEELERYLLQDRTFSALKDADPAFFESALRVSGGSIGQARALLQQKKNGGQSSPLMDALFSLFSAPTRAEVFALSYRLPAKRQELDCFLEQFQIAVRDLMLIRKGGKEEYLLYFSDAAAAEEAGRPLTAEQMSALYRFAVGLRERLGKNINIQNARMAFAVGLYKAIS